MDLNEIKGSWNELNKELQRNEIVNAYIIKEMVMQRSQSAQQRIFRIFLLIGVSIPVLMAIFPILLDEIGIGHKGVFLPFVEILLAYCLVTQAVMIYYIHRMDIRYRSVTEVAYSALMFRRWFKIRIILGIPAAVVFIFFYIYELYISTDLLSENVFWVSSAISLLIAAFLIVIKMKKVFHSIKVIEKSIDELRELKNGK